MYSFKQSRILIILINEIIYSFFLILRMNVNRSAWIDNLYALFQLMSASVSNYSGVYLCTVVSYQKC